MRKSIIISFLLAVMNFAGYIIAEAQNVGSMSNDTNTPSEQYSYLIPQDGLS